MPRWTRGWAGEVEVVVVRVGASCRREVFTLRGPWGTLGRLVCCAGGRRVQLAAASGINLLGAAALDPLDEWQTRLDVCCGRQ